MAYKHWNLKTIDWILRNIYSFLPPVHIYIFLQGQSKYVDFDILSSIMHICNVLFTSQFLLYVQFMLFQD